MKLSDQQLQVGDSVENIFTGEKMTIVKITHKPTFYQCVWFSPENDLQRDLFLSRHIRIIPFLKHTNKEIRLKNKVYFNHQDFSAGSTSTGPIMEVIDLIEATGEKLAVCKWENASKEIDADIFPVLALKT
ncbi:hypothetical protein [Xanthocytophaga agilis]|uniref:Uncharacterized protein n=1 Tax=Xanthocytophaga agilis TaxID=3048010 RepID=A0AAE3UID4_9BACT|nr:hypothetical protein [Xanthocytophaga agilis]MDJ1506445.1 hypothetical protein [Xanthocytophaga agilis]